MANERVWFPVSAGLFEHFSRMGLAIWVFLWFVHHEHQPKDGGQAGLVNKGKPVTYDEIAKEIPGLSPFTVRHHVKRLQENGYIRSEQVRGGKAYYIGKPFRWGWKKSESGPEQVELIIETWLLWVPETSGSPALPPPAMKQLGDGERVPSAETRAEGAAILEKCLKEFAEKFNWKDEPKVKEAMTPGQMKARRELLKQQAAEIERLHPMKEQTT